MNIEGATTHRSHKREAISDLNGSEPPTKKSKTADYALMMKVASVLEIHELFTLIAIEMDPKTFAALCCVNKLCQRVGKHVFKEVHAFFQSLIGLHISAETPHNKYLDTYEKYGVNLCKNVNRLIDLKQIRLAEDSTLLNNIQFSCMPLLRSFITASTKLEVWRVLSTNMQVTGIDCTNLNSIRSYVEEANNFSNWCSEKIDQLAELRMLNFKSMRLTLAPKEIGFLFGLQSLDFSYNQITALPTEIGQLVFLREVQLSENQLTVLPSELARLPLLKKLDLTGNPFTDGELDQ